MRDKNKGQYHKIYMQEYKLAQEILKDEPGQLEWSDHDHQAFTYKEKEVTIVFYPHKTQSTRNKHIRILNQQSRNEDRAIELMRKLYDGATGCTFQCKHFSSVIGHIYDRKRLDHERRNRRGKKK